MRNADFEASLEGLSSAEDFLDHFEIEYDQRVVHVNRLHILQRFHDYLEKDAEEPEGEEASEVYYTKWLTKAYHDFVASDALTEKVFKVLQPAPPAFVSLDSLRR
ncbi:MAG: nitrogenase-stabilizing/protective protein NifW [Pseudomonadota bacterium]